MNVFKVVRVSFQLLQAHKVRTFLSCSTIMIGIASFVLMLGSGKSAQQDIGEQLRNIGTNQVSIAAASFEAIGDREQEVESYTTLSLKDVDLLATLPSVVNISGYADRTGSIGFRNRHVDTQVCGVEVAYARMKRITTIKGRFFSADEQSRLKRVVVIGFALAQDLFLDSEPIGQYVSIDKVPFVVVGVGKRRSSSNFASPEDYVAYVPLQTALFRLFHVNYLQKIVLEAKNLLDLTSVSTGAESLLRRSHRLPKQMKNDFTISKEADSLKLEQHTAKILRTILLTITIVSLAIGGFGILAIMLLSAKERVREIGLRQALGATQADIALQFLFEAVLISASGGILGIALGLGGINILCRIFGWPVIYPFDGALLALVFSTLIGLIFGLKPAVVSSRMDPAESLRSDV